MVSIIVLEVFVRVLLLGCGCCILIDLGMKVAKNQGVEMSWCKACLCTCLNPCTCYSCAVSNEALLSKAANSPVEPDAKKMDRCMDMMRMHMHIDSEQRKEEAQLRKEAAQQREIERRVATTEERKEERAQYGEERRALAQQRHDDRIERMEREDARDRRREDDRVLLEKVRQEERRDIRRQQEIHEVRREDDRQLFIQSLTLSVIGTTSIETTPISTTQNNNIIQSNRRYSSISRPSPAPDEVVLERNKSSTDKVLLKRSKSSMIN